ncbi:methylated-DNA--[protein]-cysteine S-methyltransferase [Aestuariibacter halophilus]|uniref:Methylated-DNA--protein-cysteine methyltransferase n=1 Tax=Fluctibacter halophilus TaxID=226011 RepID=A0ABS8G976_9ALTE|nr:methylated-DNA--[protein]-cysteine S-methyltransferase [Aestuariibacter halophilus]MCC2617122.1 methylated-DNA--[protein]-cysteine S-methyltransferase [Aestuariibacter halophilus]
MNNGSDKISRTTVKTPLGDLTVQCNPKGLQWALFDKEQEFTKAINNDPDAQRWLNAAVTQLQDYFAGTRFAFDIPLVPHGTVFQHQVWGSLIDIPYGSTCSYGDIAVRLSNPRAVRAVGAANGRNPVSIIVPCHRVIGRSGALTGYAGGLDRKAWLLAHEHNMLSARGVRR